VFERFTERARRVLFFSRYEASQLGSVSIETEHLLLGLIREGKGVTRRIFAQANVDLETLRKEAESAAVFKEKVSTSVEIPFSGEVTRVLTYTAQEADRLEHSYIGTEHLLLGLLREESSKAGVILAARGLHYDAVRKDLLRLLSEPPDPSPGPETPAELVAAINQIKRKVSTLAELASRADDGDARAIELAEAIHRDLERLKPRPSS
jgi:ATP-dependent Clp protease ATP-binding subunit ClpC